MTLAELEAGCLQWIPITWLFCWWKWCFLCLSRSWTNAKSSCFVFAVLIKMKPPQLEVGENNSLMK